MSQSIWNARKRPIFGLPISFTTYELLEEKLIIKSGILNIREEEIRLYRIMDITLHANILDRIFGVGKIHCCSADKTTPDFEIGPVKDARNVKEMLSNQIEKVRDEKGITAGEFIGPAHGRSE